MHHESVLEARALVAVHDVDPVPILLRIVDEFLRAMTGLPQLVPEGGNLSHIADRPDPEARLEIRNNVVEADDSPGTNQRREHLEIAGLARVSVVAVDEQHVDEAVPEPLAHLSERLGIVRISHQARYVL